MLNRDIEKMRSLAEKIRKLNGKIKLISLLDKAHQEYEQSNYKECENTCKKILETQPNNFVALRGLGCVAQNKGDYELALEYYNKSLKTSLKKEIDYTLIGTIYYLQDNLEEAIKYYNLAIDENENYDSAYDGRNQAMLENHLKIIDLQENLIQRKIF